MNIALYAQVKIPLRPLILLGALRTVTSRVSSPAPISTGSESKVIIA